MGHVLRPARSSSRPPPPGRPPAGPPLLGANWGRPLGAGGGTPRALLHSPAGRGSAEARGSGAARAGWGALPGPALRPRSYLPNRGHGRSGRRLPTGAGRPPSPPCSSRSPSRAGRWGNAGPTATERKPRAPCRRWAGLPAACTGRGGPEAGGGAMGGGTPGGGTLVPTPPLFLSSWVIFSLRYAH